MSACPKYRNGKKSKKIILFKTDIKVIKKIILFKTDIKVIKKIILFKKK